MRWDLESQFRGWKQSLKLDNALNRKSSEGHLMALILAAMIHQILTLRIRQKIQPALPRGKLSIEKLSTLLAQFHLGAVSLDSLAESKPDLRHLSKDTRRRKPPVTIGFAALA